MSRTTAAQPGRLAAVKHWALRIECVIGVVLLLVLYVLLITQVFFRYVLNSPLGWSEELARFAFIWMIFIGSAYLAGRNAHIAVTFLADSFAPAAARWIIRTAAAVVTLAAAVVAVSSVSFVSATTNLLSPAVGLPMGLIYAAPMLSFALIAIHMLEYIITGEAAEGHEEVSAAEDPESAVVAPDPVPEDLRQERSAP